MHRQIQCAETQIGGRLVRIRCLTIWLTCRLDAVWEHPGVGLPGRTAAAEYPLSIGHEGAPAVQQPVTVHRGRDAFWPEFSLD